MPWPPEGWLAHPSAPGQFYSGQECLFEQDLRNRFGYPPATAVGPAVAPVVPQPTAPNAGAQVGPLTEAERARYAELLEMASREGTLTDALMTEFTSLMDRGAGA